jgi:lipopolysaccharide biosynthesis glycosyltransferase
LLIPELLPRHLSRALYLDADVLVRHDPSPLFAIALGDAIVGAARDAAITSTDHELSGVRDRALARPYFNTGVLVMDMERWREAGLTERALGYAAASAEPLRWAEQDALNAVLDTWHELDPRWNTQHSLFLSRDRFRAAGIWHFVGGKPWNPKCQAPGTMSWAAGLLRSGWYTPREGVVWLLGWLGARCWLDRSGTPRWEPLLRRLRRPRPG